MQAIIREKDRSIDRLEDDLNKAGQREEDLKQMHNNYMLKVQSLINARALSAPSGPQEGRKTNTREEGKQASTRRRYSHFQDSDLHFQDRKKHA